jgi:hypothetical protein
VFLHSQLETTLAHIACAGWEIKSLKERLNSKGKAKKRKVQVNAQYISSAEATRILAEQEQADAEKRQREEEAQAAKKAKDDQRKQQREAGGKIFSGSLNNKAKDDLLDITFALKLTGSDSNTQETKAMLSSMINHHLDLNPDIASNPTFAGLFHSQTHGRRRNANGEDSTSTSTTPPSTLLPPAPRSFPPEPAHDTLELETEVPLVLFNQLPNARGFSRPIDANSTSHSFGPPAPPPLPAFWPQFTDTQFPSPYFTSPL